VASVWRPLRKPWDLHDAAEVERIIRHPAKRMQREAPGVSISILEDMDEIRTVTRLCLRRELRRSLACTNAIENCRARSDGSSAT
jgi:putative transposase